MEETPWEEPAIPPSGKAPPSKYIEAVASKLIDTFPMDGCGMDNLALMA